MPGFEVSWQGYGVNFFLQLDTGVILLVASVALVFWVRAEVFYFLRI
jgi:hypothetical protein